MHNERAIIENAIRLIQKARLMDTSVAAKYLEPLCHLTIRPDDAERANATCILLSVLDTLNHNHVVKVSEWDDAVDAFEAWRDTF